MARFERGSLPPINRGELLLDTTLFDRNHTAHAKRLEQLAREIKRYEGLIADELLQTNGRPMNSLLDMLGAQLVDLVKRRSIAKGQYNSSQVRAELETRFDRLTKAVATTPIEEPTITRGATRVHRIHSEIEVPREVLNSPKARRTLH